MAEGGANYQEYTERELFDAVKSARLNRDLERSTRLSKLLEKGKAVGFLVIPVPGGNDFGNVFHHGNGSVVTCAHVVENVEGVSSARLVFCWLNDDGMENKVQFSADMNRPVTIGTPTLAGDASDNASSASDGLDYDKDLAVFYMKDNVNLNTLPVIKTETQFGVPTWVNEGTMEPTPNPQPYTPPANGDTIYHIFWKEQIDGSAEKMFVITKYGGTGDPCDPNQFMFRSPAPEGASGSPIMVYRKQFPNDDNGEEEFSLIGVMSEGSEASRRVQFAESRLAVSAFTDLTKWVGATIERGKYYILIEESLRNHSTEPAITVQEHEQELVQELADEAGGVIHNN